MLALLGSTPAAASLCTIDDEAASPTLAAQRILRDAKHVGFAMIRQRQDPASRQPEIIEMLDPLKGGGGSLKMRQPINEDGSLVVIGGTLTSFDLPVGSMVFAVLYGKDDDLVTVGCTDMLFERGDRAAVIRALIESSKR